FRDCLEPLLLADGWKLCGAGFEDINKFMNSLRLDKFRVIADERKQIAQRIKELQPEVSNRQIARTLGVDEGTIRNDVAAENSARDNGVSRRSDNPGAENSARHLSGRQAAITLNRRERNSQPREHDLKSSDLPEGRFPILLADPPWRYENA